MSAQHTSGDLLADRRYAYAEACLSEGDAHGACEMAEQALELAPLFAPAWFLLGRAREARTRGSGDEAAFQSVLRAYANALDIDPEDRLGARIHLARMGDGCVLEALSPAYIRALFDGYAQRFDRHLVGDLQYRGPAMLMAALGEAAGPTAHFETGLDLGCGTGLMGEALAGRVGHLTGVDLSPEMLALAARGHCYRRLVVDDLRTFLTTEPAGQADLVVAADVFIYLPGLGPILAGIAAALRPGGICAFTVQSHDGTGIRLGEDGRYAHGDDHLLTAVTGAGLRIVSNAPAAIRKERGVDVPGRIMVLGRAAM
ncbi:methyltransferase domain-containing protein [uncultured Methylobacterium sp.]|uniref:class I SAM-dependent DNA methyltransferase n=1 Tax=uncultured Methylobacterium sp. TaxID=157278 RepID=UPI0035CC731B